MQTRKMLLSALASFSVVVGILTLVAGYSSNGVAKAIQFLSIIGLGVVVIFGVVSLVVVRLGDWHNPRSEDEFERIVRRTEALAASDSWGDSEDYEDPDDDPELFDPAQEDEDFKALVRSAIDELPLEFHRALEHVAVVVSDKGSRAQVARGRRGAYGLYEGGTVSRDYFHDRIIIFRDTLVRDFGHDPELLRQQVTKTVRHELAHHLGWDERGVRDLGL